MSPHLFLAFFIVSVLQSCIGQSVKQTEGVVTVIQGDQILINCSYELSSPYQPNLFWYVQHPGLPPKFFLSHLGNISMQLHQGFQAKHDKKQKTFNLKKSVSQLSDSAFYICAVSDTVKLCRRGANLKLARGKIKRKHVDRWHHTLNFADYNMEDSPVNITVDPTLPVRIQGGLFLIKRNSKLDTNEEHNRTEQEDCMKDCITLYEPSFKLFRGRLFSRFYRLLKTIW